MSCKLDAVGVHGEATRKNNFCDAARFNHAEFAVCFDMLQQVNSESKIMQCYALRCTYTHVTTVRILFFLSHKCLSRKSLTKHEARIEGILQLGKL